VDSGYYAACTALKTQSNALELIANNVANINTSGYRAQLPSFESLLVEGRNSTPSNGWSRLVNQFAVLNGARLDLAEGNLQRTGNPLDLALDGPGFFAVQTKAGVLYTRDGNFRLSAKGQLTTASGDAVLGIAGPINVPGNAQIAIGPDGTISVAGAVTAVGGQYYSVPATAVSPALHTQIQAGMLESSNVNPVAAVVALIAAQRQAEMVGRAMSAFYTDFNRVAADELPRV
jgi:flagellar basal-body rod protein FlgF